MTATPGPDRGRWQNRFDSSLTRMSLLAEVLPRAVLSSRSASHRAAATGIPPSAFGVRQVGETALDEFFIAGFSLLRAVPDEDDIRANVDRCALVGSRLRALPMTEANPEPPELRIQRSIRRKLGPVAYERLDYASPDPHALLLSGDKTKTAATVRVLEHRERGHPWLLWIHGAGQGRIDDLMSLRAAFLHEELGYNVVFPVLPGHGLRRSKGVTFPGFDPMANVALTARGIAEVRALVRWMHAQDPTPITVGGISLGGPVAAIVAGLEPQVQSVIAVVPMLDLHATMAHHLLRGGDRGRAIADLLRSDPVQDVTSVVDPLRVVPHAQADRRLVVAALNDRVTSVAAAERLHAHWSGPVHWYPGGHIGGVMSSAVRAAITDFASVQT